MLIKECMRSLLRLEYELGCVLILRKCSSGKQILFGTYYCQSCQEHESDSWCGRYFTLSLIWSLENLERRRESLCNVKCNFFGVCVCIVCICICQQRTKSMNNSVTLNKSLNSNHNFRIAKQIIMNIILTSSH